MEERIVVWAGDSEVTDEEEDEFIPHNPLERPNISYKKPIIAFTVYVIQLLALIFIPYGRWWIMALVLTGYSLIYFSFIAKRTVIPDLSWRSL